MFLNGRRCVPSPPRRPPSRLVALPAGAPRRGVARAPAAGGAAPATAPLRVTAGKSKRCMCQWSRTLKSSLESKRDHPPFEELAVLLPR